MKRRKLGFIKVVLLVSLVLNFIQCETQESLTKKRIKSVEQGLLRGVYLKGTRPEKLSLFDRLQFYRVPGVSLAVMDGFQIEWARGYGTKNIAQAEPVDENTLFQAGALSQVLATLATLSLVDEGLIELDQPVNTYLRRWKMPIYSVNRQRRLTIRDILTHSAGFYEIEFQGYTPGDSLPTLVDILEGKSPARNPKLYPVYPPGTQRVYSEAGFVLLQLLLEDVTGQDFAQLVKERVIQPLHLANTTFECPLPPALQARAAQGYNRQGQPLPGGARIFPQQAAAGLWTTPTDLLHLSLALIKMARGEERDVISPLLIREMLTPRLGLQAMAFLVEGSGDDLRFYLEGYNPGFSAFLVVYPSRGQGVAIMANSDNGLYLSEEILRAVAANYNWPHFQPEEKTPYRLPVEIYQEYVGRYEVNPQYHLDVRYEDYYLIIHPTGQVPTRFYAESKSTFFAVDPYIQIQFLRDRQGRVTGLVLRQKRTRVEAKKVS